MKPLRLNPRAKLFLILLCVLSAMFAPSLSFQFALGKHQQVHRGQHNSALPMGI